MEILRSRMLNFIQLQEFSNYRGKLVHFNVKDDNLPFEIKRIYHISQVPKGESRGMHGHLELEQVIFAISGSFKLDLWHGSNEFHFILDNPSIGVHVPKKSWRELSNFSDNAVCLVLASDVYNPRDYFYDKNQFIEIVNSLKC